MTEKPRGGYIPSREKQGQFNYQATDAENQLLGEQQVSGSEYEEPPPAREFEICATAGTAGAAEAGAVGAAAEAGAGATGAAKPAGAGAAEAGATGTAKPAGAGAAGVSAKARAAGTAAAGGTEANAGEVVVSGLVVS